MTMSLYRVTISGVDESVSPLDLLGLSAAYHFVEWGLLISATYTHPSTGMPRWPSMAWMAHLMAAARVEPLQLAVHICGTWVQDIVEGRASMLPALRETVARVQLNFAGRPLVNYDAARFVQALTDPPERPVIFQIGGPGGAQAWVEAAARLHATCLPLFDDSHGTGLCPPQWTSMRDLDPRPRRVGYAGGLGPHNLAAHLPRIAAAAGEVPCWIDMESGVRTHGQLDLAKVERCLALTAPYVRDTAAR
jgi:N-(5'phosphoribosyl)anthranilate (PRA) isomerase